MARSQRGQWGLLFGGMGESAKAFGTRWLGYPKLGNYGVGSTNEVVVVAKNSTDRAWSGLGIPSHPHARGMFAISVITNMGNERNILFWIDRWLHGCSLVDMASEVVVCVPSRILKTLKVEEALDNRVWVQDIRGGLS